MWEQITKADIQRARTQLSLRREETLRRHAEELAGVDAQLHDIERFEAIVAAFSEEYISTEPASALPEDESSLSLAPNEHLKCRFSNPSSASEIRWIVGNTPLDQRGSAQPSLVYARLRIGRAPLGGGALSFFNSQSRTAFLIFRLNAVKIRLRPALRS